MANFFSIWVDNWAFSFVGALAVSCIFPQNWAPWCDLDLTFRKALESFLRSSKGGWVVNEEAWKNSYGERVSLFKYAVWGLVLILILPLNSMTKSAWFIDYLWGVVEQVRHVLSLATGNLRLFSSSEWRDAPYELWETCVFLWVFPIIGRWIRRDYVRLARYSPSRDADMHFQTGQRLANFVFILSMLGALFLVVVQSPRYRVMVELLVVGTLGAADLYFCRKWLALGRTHDAIEHFEVFLMIDMGALIGFVSLLLFLEVTSFSYKSHWSSAFVAGASALNLLLANTSSLVSRGVQNYREHAHLGSKIDSGDRQVHA